MASEEKQLKEVITKGSKSFSLASMVLPPKMKRGAYLLYRWCRYCDDQIDEAPDLATAVLRLNDLRSKTLLAFQNKDDLVEPEFRGLFELDTTYQVPQVHFFEMLEGFKMDVEGCHIQTVEDLEKYCYHVAGVVGLLMSPILQVQEAKALQYADSLGRAMQFTNICRDVSQDFSMGRIYIPAIWLDNEGILGTQLMSIDHREKVWKMVLRLLELADRRYCEGRKGLIYLPFRAGLAISIASRLYQKIGLKLRKRGAKGLDSRTVLNILEKITAVYLGIFDFVLLSILKSPITMKKKG